MIFFFSLIISILYYLGAMQWFVMKLGWILRSVLGTTVCESVTCGANIFLGMSESPLLIRPYIKVCIIQLFYYHSFENNLILLAPNTFGNSRYNGIWLCNGIWFCFGSIYFVRSRACSLNYIQCDGCSCRLVLCQVVLSRNRRK